MSEEGTKLKSITDITSETLSMTGENYPVQYSVQYVTVQCTQHPSVQHSALKAVKYSTVQYTILHLSPSKQIFSMTLR